MYKKNIRKSKGITLIALVITIIILIILAGVAISLSLGENGIFNKAKYGKKQMKIASAKEEIELEIVNEQIRVEGSENSQEEFNYENVWTELRQKDKNLLVVEKSDGYEILYKGYWFKIDANKKVTYIDKRQLAENEYEIIYCKNDASSVIIQQIEEKGTEVILANDKFTRGGYDFIGWYANAEGTGEAITKVSDTINVYAKWQKQTEISSKGEVTIDEITYTDSYEIWNKEQLEDFRNKVNAENDFEGCLVKQMADIDLESDEWTPIGDYSSNKPFSGTYEGNGSKKKIDNLKIDNTSNYQGLFSYVKNGTIKNIEVDGEVTAGSRTGAVVGCVENGIINNVTNKTEVNHSGTYSEKTSYNQYEFEIGGVCGATINGANIINCRNEGDVNIGANLVTNFTENSPTAAGIVGYVYASAQGTSITGCCNIGKITIEKTSKKTAYPVSAGIVGICFDVTITNCWNSGEITQADNLGNVITENACSGGIVGHLAKNSVNTTVSKCWNKGKIKSHTVGGIVSNCASGAKVEYCYNTGKIEGDYNCGGDVKRECRSGGIVGLFQLNATIEKCYNKGEISSNGCVPNVASGRFTGAGGIAGYSGGTILKCYNIGTISANVGTANTGCGIGGITGVIVDNGNANNCYNAGSLNGTGTYVCSGGIVGWVNERTKTANSYNLYNIGSITNTSTNKQMGRNIRSLDYRKRLD